MNPGDAPRRPAAPTGAPGHPQPPARGPRGTPGFVAWFPVNHAPSATIVNFSTLRPPAAATARGPRPRGPLDTLDHLSPLPYSPISILLKLTFRPPGPRAPGWLIAPHASSPSGVGGLTGLRPLPPTPERKKAHMFSAWKNSGGDIDGSESNSCQCGFGGSRTR